MGESVSALLARHGFRLSKSMGQNFLIDPSVPERIAESAGLDGSVHVLEIGPGVGALTARLCARAGFVTAVELDRKLLPLLGETLAAYKNYRIVQGDALKLDLRAAMDGGAALPRRAVCANLPYNITTPVLTRLLESGTFETVTVMVQREVARRVCAKAGTPDYGAFSVFAQYHASPEILFDVPPECFMPRPKVTSSVVRLRVTEKPACVSDERMFFRVVRASFAQRRKTLANALSASFSDIPKQALTDMLLRCGLDALVRGETLDIEAFAAVADGIIGLRAVNAED
ncbi:MAG: 16S rRNA (adenine(1518)-N(6)/adenine(1519)-N(6))-dimethyltransferase RsmA [Oscillospiraceae bacterium]|jgi:16S rRNA (adenine1518-N6/adenine1519-N6)-dimethyltransferase|nr:16S rRNA (adenine(1518)-N(6)/adenine(1519)-N(6))-dimethyltransferase RsmA [Oscillospiraceae bacterium]